MDNGQVRDGVIAFCLGSIWEATYAFVDSHCPRFSPRRSRFMMYCVQSKRGFLNWRCSVIPRAMRSGTFVFLLRPRGKTPAVKWSRLDAFLVHYSWHATPETEYYSFGGSYVNSAAFALYSCVPTTPISFHLRRRDGVLPHFGSPSSAFHFYMPSQCTGLGTAECDVDLIQSFELGLAQNAAVLDRIESALSFFESANRDDPSMSMKNELVMMVAAYEHLLQPNAGTVELAGRVSQAF